MRDESELGTGFSGAGWEPASLTQQVESPQPQGASLLQSCRADAAKPGRCASTMARLNRMATATFKWIQCSAFDA